MQHNHLVVQSNKYDDPINISKPKSKGTREVEGIIISSGQFLQPLKIKEVHIGSQKNSEFANNRDYWDDEAIANIIDLLQEYHNLFHTNFAEMRGIVRDLGEMKIPLRLSAQLTKQQQKAWHGQYIRVNPSQEGRLVLRYYNNLVKQPSKLKTHWLRPYRIVHSN